MRGCLTGSPNGETNTQRTLRKEVLKLLGQMPDGGRPLCDCKECGWKGVALKSLEMLANALNVARAAAFDGEAKNDTIKKAQSEAEAVSKENKRLAKANRELNAARNGIKAVPRKERASTGRRGRPPGQKPTINKRPEKVDREEVADVKVCPKCRKGDCLSEKPTHEYDRIVKVLHTYMENVRYTIRRRYCRRCKMQVSRQPPGASKYSRHSAGFDADVVCHNMDGISHGRIANRAKDVLGEKMSRSSSYRKKIRAAKNMAPFHEQVKEDILKEPCLFCDEMHWTVGEESSGMVINVQGTKTCLSFVVHSATIEAVQEMLPGYDGTVVQDSKTIWLHVGKDRQMCMSHQIRIPKKDLKYSAPKNDPEEFLGAAKRILQRHYTYDEIEDIHTRRVAAACLNSALSEIMNHNYTDDKNGTIKRYKKRYRREGYFLSTHLEKAGTPIDNNPIERTNRRFVAVRHDGGGNRSQKGMDANSILFTAFATDWLRGENFFEHPIRAASGDG